MVAIDRSSGVRTQERGQEQRPEEQQAPEANATSKAEQSGQVEPESGGPAEATEPVAEASFTRTSVRRTRANPTATDAEPSPDTSNGTSTEAWSEAPDDALVDPSVSYTQAADGSLRVLRGGNPDLRLDPIPPDRSLEPAGPEAPALDEDLRSVAGTGATTEIDEHGNPISDNKLYDEHENLVVQDTVRTNQNGVETHKTVLYDPTTGLPTEAHNRFEQDGKNYEDFYRYDAEGKISGRKRTVRGVDENGDPTETVAYHRYGADGKPIEVSNPYDALGMPPEQAGRAPPPVKERSFYNEDGERVVSQEISEDGDGNATRNTTLLDPDSGQAQLEIVQGLDSANESNRSTTRYDDEGHLAATTYETVDERRNPTTYSEQFDENGHRIAEQTESIDENGDPRTESFAFDPEGNVTARQTATVDEHGNPRVDGTQYDDQGRVVGKNQSYVNPQNDTAVDVRTQFDPETGLRTGVTKHSAKTDGTQVLQQLRYGESGELSGSTTTTMTSPDENGYYKWSETIARADGEMLSRLEREERDEQLAVDNKVQARIQEMVLAEDNIEIVESVPVQEGRRRYKESDDWHTETYQYVTLNGDRERFTVQPDGTARIDGKDFPIRVDANGNPILVTKHNEVDVAAKIRNQLSGNGDPEGPTFETLYADAQQEVWFENLQKGGQTDLTTKQFQALSENERAALVNQGVADAVRAGRPISVSQLSTMPPEVRQTLMDDDAARARIEQDIVNEARGLRPLMRGIQDETLNYTTSRERIADLDQENERIAREAQQVQTGTLENGMQYTIVGNPSQEFVDATIAELNRSFPAGSYDPALLDSLNEVVIAETTAQGATYTYNLPTTVRDQAYISGFYHHNNVVLAEYEYRPEYVADVTTGEMTSVYYKEKIDQDWYLGTAPHEIAHAIQNSGSFGQYAGPDRFQHELADTLSAEIAGMGEDLKEQLRSGAAYPGLTRWAPIGVPADSDEELEYAVRDELVATAVQALLGQPGHYPGLSGENGEMLHELFPDTVAIVEQRLIANGLNVVNPTERTRAKIDEALADSSIDPDTGTLTVNATMDQINDRDFMTALALLDNRTGAPSDGLGNVVFDDIRVAVPDAHRPAFKPYFGPPRPQFKPDLSLPPPPIPAPRPADLTVDPELQPPRMRGIVNGLPSEEEPNWFESAADWVSNTWGNVVDAVVNDWNQRLEQQARDREKGDELAGSWDYNPRAGRWEYKAPGETEVSQTWDSPGWFDRVMDWADRTFGGGGQSGGTKKKDDHEPGDKRDPFDDGPEPDPVDGDGWGEKGDGAI